MGALGGKRLHNLMKRIYVIVPFAWMNNRQVYDAVLKGERPSIPKNCPPEIAKLMQECWQADPNKRPSFAKIVEILKGVSPEERKSSMIVSRPLPVPQPRTTITKTNSSESFYKN